MGRAIGGLYLDTIELHPELSDEELDEFIKQEDEKSQQLKEWPLM